MYESAIPVFWIYISRQLDTEYAAKNKRRSKSIAGTIILNNREIRFDSGYELIFLDFIFEKCLFHPNMDR